jgi:hypothetical protein
MSDFAFVSNTDNGISRNISQRGFEFKRYDFKDLSLALSNGHRFTSVFDDGSLSIEDLRSLSQKCDELYVPDFFRFSELDRSGAQVRLFHHWVDENFFYYKKRSSFVFDCFCYEGADEELLRLLRKRFNVFVCDKSLTDGAKCSLLQKSKIYCHSEKDDLIGKEIFEAGGCGKMVLCNEIPSKEGMEMFFENGVHLVSYENIEDCLKKIDLYLEDEYTRYEIGEGIYNQIKKMHTSRKRAKEIIRDFIK